MKQSLTQARESKLWSLSQLAAKSGIAVTTIAAIERGAKPRRATIEKLATALEVAPWDIAWPDYSGEWIAPKGRYFRATFRECLQELRKLGNYELDLRRAMIPDDLLQEMPDDETAWWQAPATLELYDPAELVEGSDVVGNLEVEYIRAVAQGPYGPEIVFHKERYVVRSKPDQKRDSA